LQPLQPPPPCCNVQLRPRGPAHAGAPHARPHARAAARGRERGGRAERRRSAGAPVLRPHATHIAERHAQPRARARATAHVACLQQLGALAAAARARDAAQAELVLAVRARLGVLRARVRPQLRRGRARIRAAQRLRRECCVHICAGTGFICAGTSPQPLRCAAFSFDGDLGATLSSFESARHELWNTATASSIHQARSSSVNPCRDSASWPPTSAQDLPSPSPRLGLARTCAAAPPRLGWAGRNKASVFAPSCAELFSGLRAQVSSVLTCGDVRRKPGQCRARSQALARFIPDVERHTVVSLHERNSHRPAPIALWTRFLVGPAPLGLLGLTAAMRCRVRTASAQRVPLAAVETHAAEHAPACNVAHTLLPWAQNLPTTQPALGGQATAQGDKQRRK
jgi:hypothetical protein